ncbi:MAG: site-specific integrase [Alphaproteobacteria bacterium]|nr:site-specific integrase [Alphaproteobacteria bacterium]
MATIQRRGAHQWRAQVRRLGWPKQSKTFDTKGEAEAWAALVESEMNRGVWLDRSEAESTILRELLDRYEREVVPGKRGSVQECSVLATWRDTPLAVRTVATIRGADVAVLRDEWLKTYAPATVLRRLAVLSHVFNVARKEWGMESLANPVELVRKPSPNNARTRRIVTAPPAANHRRGRMQDELALVVEASESPMLPALVTLAVETAMRRGEIAALRWEHIDLERRVAHLPETKNGNSRDVPLSPAAVAALAALLPESPAKRRKKPVVPAELRGRVFAMRPDGITQAFDRAQHRARAAYEAKCRRESASIDPDFLNDLRFHDLRHEATSRLAGKFQLHELAKITGHRDTRMLLRYYHPDAADLAKRLR